MAIEKKTLYLMGTQIQLLVEHDQKEDILGQAEQTLIDYEQRFSANDKTSELMKITQQAGVAAVKVQDDLFELIQIGKEQSLIPNGYLNIAIGPLVQAWRIGFADAQYPSKEKIASCLALIDPNDIHLNSEKKEVYLAKAGMSIDLGALAKGYFADKIVALFKKKGASAGFINLGGNILTFGEAPHHADGYWRIGIQNPFLPRGNYVATLLIKNQSVVTSGIYERTFEWQGKTYHHIFDSQTGFPVQSELASLTIVSQESLVGEIWTTRLFGTEATTIIREVEATPGLEGIVITTDGRTANTQGLTFRT